jgi:hypothetical protein
VEKTLQVTLPEKFIVKESLVDSKVRHNHLEKVCTVSKVKVVVTYQQSPLRVQKVAVITCPTTVMTTNCSTERQAQNFHTTQRPKKLSFGVAKKKVQDSRWAILGLLSHTLEMSISNLIPDHVYSLETF